MTGKVVTFKRKSRYLQLFIISTITSYKTSLKTAASKGYNGLGLISELSIYIHQNVTLLQGSSV